MNPDIRSVEQLLSTLSREERDELLESLLISICTNPGQVQENLSALVREHRFQLLIRDLEIEHSCEEETL